MRGLRLALSLTVGPSAAAFDPATLSPTAWWDTSDTTTTYQTTDTSTPAANTNPLGRISDKAGTNHLIQATAGKRPTLTANGADLDGTDDALATSAALGGTFDIWYVIKADAGSYVMGYDSSNSASEYFGVVASGDAGDSRAAGVTDHGVYVNGAAVGTPDTAPTRAQMFTAIGTTNKKVVEFRGITIAFATLVIGDYGGFVLNGQLAELLVLTGMDATKRTNLLAHLTSKWGVA